MKHLFIIPVMLILFSSKLKAQEKPVSKSKFVFGISAPELIHVGLNYRISNSNLIGGSFGLGPSLGTIWTSISLEHRLYVGKNSQSTNQKTWFFRQGTTFFPQARSPRQFTFNLSVGKDFVFRNIKNGFTIDAGVFYLPDSESSSIILIRSLNLWPSLRFQFYFSNK
ncbi:MAG: hypothetical protein KDF60_18800 [Calditrichaeota bacterium]|nr:hypothetical protein [Calditrichota bacterium]